MKILSVNVGQPREVETPRGIVLTSIFKEPIVGRALVRGSNVVGDRQSDLTVHGGPDKAVYAYSSEHYPYWMSQLKRDLKPGSFGENLTTEGLLEDDVQIGDEYRIGTTVLRVTQPRMPCFKPTMVKQFWASGRSGIYFAVVEEGDLGAGDLIELLKRVPKSVTVVDVIRAYKGEVTDGGILDRALASPLTDSWKSGIWERRQHA
jgi:MOSC domain-containing protein YiiM